MSTVMDTPLDPLLQQAAMRRATQVELRPDAPVEMTTPSGVVSGKAIPSDQLLSLLSKTLPPSAWGELEKTGQVAWTLTSRHGRFYLIARKSGAGVSATLQAVISGASAPPPGGPPPPSWYYADGTQRLGPVSEADLRAMFQSGRLGPDTLVWQEGMVDWVRASQTAFLGAPGVPPPPGYPPPPPPGYTPGPAYPAGSPMPSSRPSVGVIAVVAGILITVGAVLMTAMNSAAKREGLKAKQSQSLNNVKQLTTAVMMYAQDYDETFPGWVDGGTLSPAVPGMFHNTWDEQIIVQVESTGAFSNGKTGLKSPSDPNKERVLTYAINGALIAPVNAAGTVAWTDATAGNGPALLGPSSVSSPAETIMFAEIATDSAPPTQPAGAVSRRPDAVTGEDVTMDGNGTDAWRRAQPLLAENSVIDISPREWVTQGVKGGIPYNEATWEQNGYGTPINSKGVARDFYARGVYAGGGTYGFVDGHVKFMTIGETVGIGRAVEQRTITADNCWSPSNPHNMWYTNR